MGGIIIRNNHHIVTLHIASVIKGTTIIIENCQNLRVIYMPNVEMRTLILRDVPRLEKTYCPKIAHIIGLQ